MKLLRSLTNRIFLACAVLAVLSIGLAIYVVNIRVTREAEAELRRGLSEAGALVEQYRATLSEYFTISARLIADLPKLKAAVATDDPPTVQPLAVDYRARAKAELLVVTDRNGRVLAAVGEPRTASAPTMAAPVRDALEGYESTAFWPHPKGVLQIVTVPIAIGLTPPEMLGTLSLGFLLDDKLAQQFKNITESEIAFAIDGQVRAATLPAGHHRELARLVGTREIARLALDGNEYVALWQPLLPSSIQAEGGGGLAPARGTSTIEATATGPAAIILQSRTDRLRLLSAIHTGLVATALFAVLVATGLSYAVARTVTRPLATITSAMREIAATGDLTRKIVLRPGGWDDEDARVVARAFNTLTDSIARFQQEAAQRERLSSLGRLSTVVAHEIRNPLMIIKASLRTLKGDEVASDDAREALADIEGEAARLNRIVNEVLDFARPVRFEYAPVDLNAICADAAAAADAGDGQPAPVALDLDPSLPAAVTDGERLRTALINILANSRQAVAARAEVSAGPPGGGALKDLKDMTGPLRPGPDLQAGAEAAGPEPAISLRTRRLDGLRAVIIVRDSGVGIEPADLPHVFDPYFTTKRTGSGLGLAIAKNILDGLGATIGVESRPLVGTTMRIELPLHAAEQT